MSRIPCRHAAAPSRVIDGSAVVIQTRKAEVSTLDEVGTLLWSAIDGKRSEQELAALVCASFEVDREQAQADVRGFLDELAGAGLVEFR
jgi:Coenzyme PQQ synthesis protein D (PqqD)